jgi:polysaccharide transporter, PST family
MPPVSHDAIREDVHIENVGRKAAIGAGFVAVRSLLVQALALAGTVVIARHLAPAELGLLALGLTISGFASLVADGGLAAGLVRSPRPPSRRELRVALGLQLIAMVMLAAVSLVLVAPFPQLRTVTALILVALPLTAFQTPAKVILERQLNYMRVALIEVGEYASYFAWAAGAVMLGYGVWGVASASIVRAFVASGLALWLVRAARVVPIVSIKESKALIRFGVRYQAVNAANLVRDQTLNVLTAVLAGTSALGLWTLASRMLQAPMLLFSTLWRISYPAMARVVADNPAPRRLLERATGLTATVSGALLCALAAASPALVPALFGPAWEKAAWILVPACVALMIGGPISVASAGYLYALGETRSVLRSAVLHTIVWLAGSAALLPVLGAPGIGVAHIPAAAVDALVLGRAARRYSGADLFRPLIAPSVAAVLAGSVGCVAGLLLSRSLASAVAAAAITVGVYAAEVALMSWLIPSLWSLRELRQLLTGTRSLRTKVFRVAAPARGGVPS